LCQNPRKDNDGADNVPLCGIRPQEETMQVNEILALKDKALFTVGPDKALAAAVAVMAEQELGSLVVIDRGHMVGILTFREVLATLADAGADWGSVRVADVMIRSPMTAAQNTDVDTLRRQMVGSPQRYTPVMDGATLLGVVSFHDVARAMLEEQTFENHMLRNYITDQPAASA
jgi:CBS domain-containing protein